MQSLKANLVWGLLLILIVASYASNPIFANPINIKNVLSQSIGLGFASLGQAFVILLGGIDLSLGAMISLLTTLIAGIYTHFPDAPIALVIIAVLLVGCGLGSINALLVVHLKISPLIATLGTMSVFQGAIFFYTKRPMGGISRDFRNLARESVWNVPVALIVFVFILLCCYLLLQHHRFGRHLYAVGSNEQVSLLSGIATDRIKFKAYVLCGLFAGLTSIYLAARMGGGGPTVGEGFEIDAITAVVIAGISLSGGQGKIQNLLAGVLILMIFNNTMNLNDVDAFLQILLKGIILIAVVSFGKKTRITTFGNAC